ALIPLAGYVPGEAAGEHPYLEPTVGAFTPWILVAVMAIGGLISGWIVYTFAPEAEGHGTDAAIDAFHNKRGDIRARIPFIKTITSALTIGTAGSAGREGPIAQIGAGFGAFLASKLKLSARDRRIMMAAGMSAGVGAIFRAPLAGALFSGEILYREADLESDVVVPSAVASTVAYSIYNMTLPPELRFTPLFGELKFHVVSPLELLPYTALAVILTAVAVLYIKTFYGTHNLFKKLPIIPHLRPAIGATLAGLVGLALYYAYGADRDLLAVLATGYGTLQKAFSANQPAVHVLLAVALVKIITTSLTIGSGGSGGVFGPSMVVGGCLGAAVGQVFHQWWPEV
ncbi:MAG: chloride channel protein, partial [Planctomycetales bacterium]|nr:chloride channel protein [Planctomycetales bacterium]